MTQPLDLPDEVLDLVEFQPIEDVLLAILRADLPSVQVETLIPDEVTFPFILARRMADLEQGGDERFVNAARFSIEVFTTDPDGDEKGALLSEAVRVVLRNAWRSSRVLPGLGVVTKVKKTAGPNRQPDWATSVGPVQYADLPSGTWRYETQYSIEVRKPR